MGIRDNSREVPESQPSWIESEGVETPEGQEVIWLTAGERRNARQKPAIWQPLPNRLTGNQRVGFRTPSGGAVRICKLLRSDG
jgi:hypothetical protein